MDYETAKQIIDDEDGARYPEALEFFRKNGIDQYDVQLVQAVAALEHCIMVRKNSEKYQKKLIDIWV